MPGFRSSLMLVGNQRNHLHIDLDTVDRYGSPTARDETRTSTPSR